MAKPKALDKTLTFYLILMGIWAVANFFLTDIYSALTAESIGDLSKTLIETVGILVSLLGVSSFFYLGKLEEIIDRDYSNANELMRDSKEHKNVALRTYESHRKSEALWTEKCKACKKSETCSIKDTVSELGEQTKETEKLAERANKLFEINDALSKTIEDLSKFFENITVRALIIGVAFFFLSIFFAIISFLTSYSVMLQLSVSFIVIGMIDMLYTWSNSYSLLSILRKNSFTYSNLRQSINDLVKVSESAEKSHNELITNLKQLCK